MIKKMDLFNTNNEKAIPQKYSPKFSDYVEKLEPCNFYKAFRIHLNKTIEQMSVFYNINWKRLEEGKIELGFMELKKIYDLMPDLDLFFMLVKNSIAEKLEYTGEGFFHLSDGGIKGAISPISREKCDFGKGFYMGTNLSQALGLISQREEPILYYLNLNLNDNKVKFKNYTIYDWLCVVTHYRGFDYLIRNNRDKAIVRKHAEDLLKDCNLIYGPIADDKLYYTMSRYLKNMINSDVMINATLCMHYGNQFTVKTQEVCDLITIKKEYRLTKFEDFVIREYFKRFLGELDERIEKVEDEYWDNNSPNFTNLVKSGGKDYELL